MHARLRTQSNAARARCTAITLLAGSVSCVTFSPAVHGQEASDAKRVRPLEEVVVTAQRRAEKLQDVPVAISVLGGVDLDRSTAQGVSESLTRVPGVSLLASNQTGGSQIAVRGVAANGAAFVGPSPIAYYLDSVPFGFVKTAIAPDSNAYDLDRVEVLRGPQGTLYGASALNGVVRVLTKDADLDDFEFKARTAASGTSGGSENYRGDLAINVPVVDGKLAVRAVAGYEDWSGWIDRTDRDDANDVERRNLRLKVNARPTDEFSIGLSAWSSRSDFGAPPTADDQERQIAVLDESLESDYDVYGMKLDYDFGGVTVTSATSYIDYLSDGGLDLIVLGLQQTRLQTRINSKVFSQELYLHSDQGESWRWTLGGMYRDAEDRNYQWRRQYVTPALWFETSESVAAFGELTRRFAGGRFEVTAGLRYFEDEVKLREVSRSTGVAPGLEARTDNKYDATSPRVTFNWHPSDNATVYLSYAEGFRSGFDQTPAARAAAPALPTADADTVGSYELGTKATVWDGRLSFDTAVYYVDWQDTQLPLSVIILGSPFAAVVNSESASGLGADFGATLAPVSGLQFGVSFSWNDLEVDKNVVSAAVGGIPVVLFSAGDRLNFSPRYTAGASADYTFPMGSGGYEAQLSLSGNYTSKIVAKALQGAAVVTRAGEDILVGRASFAIHSPDHWAASVFVDNVNDEDGIVLSGAVPSWHTRIRPRTIGLQLEYSF